MRLSVMVPICHRSAAYLLLVAVVLHLYGCDKGTDPVTIVGQTMGTSYTLRTTGLPANVTRGLIRERVERRLFNINLLMSTYDDTSELSRFNRARSTDWVDLTEDLREVILHARQVSELSGGAFDITVGPLVDAWGFGPFGPRRAPSAEQISSAIARVGFRNIEVTVAPSAIRKVHPELSIDLSGIAKGYAVDQVSLVLEKMNLRSYLVEIGGEIKVKGARSTGRPWRVALEQPEAGTRMVGRILNMVDTSIATSGDYRNFYEEDGRRYSHTIDPRTGRPVSHDLASVSVIHASTMHADAMATALMVLGPDDGLALANRLKLAAVFISRDKDGYKEVMTPQFKHFLVP